MLPRLLLALAWILMGGIKALAPGPLPQYVEATGLSSMVRLPSESVALALGLWESAVGLSLLLALGRSRLRNIALMASGLTALAMFVFLVVHQHAGPCGCLGAAVDVSRGQRLGLAGTLLILTGLSLPGRGERASPDGVVSTHLRSRPYMEKESITCYWRSAFALLTVAAAALLIILPGSPGPHSHNARYLPTSGSEPVGSVLRGSSRGAFEQEDLATGRAQSESLDVTDVRPDPIYASGHVLSQETGLPIAGAVVVLADEAGLGAPVGNGVETDEAGAWRLALPTERESMLHVIAEGYVPWAEPVGPNFDEVHVYLSKGLAISGRVVDDRGEPLSEAEIIGYSLARAYWPRGALLHPTEAQTGNRTYSRADGTFTLSGLRDGTLLVGARKRGYIGVGDTEAEVGTGDVELVLRPLIRARLAIVDAISGARIDGAKIIVTGVSEGLALQAGTANDLLGDIEDRRNVIAVVRDERGLDEAPTARHVQVRVQHPQYQHGDFLLDLSEVEIKEFRLELIPLPVGTRRSVVLKAKMADGRPFTGLLDLQTEAGAYILPFGGGVAVRPLELPVGRQMLGVRAGGPVGWWLTGQVDQFVVDGGEDTPQTASLRLGAVIVELEVIARRGQMLTEYDLQLSPAGAEGRGWYPNWGRAFERFLRQMDALGFRDLLGSRRPYVLLGPGSYMVRVRHPTEGTGSAELHIEGGSEPQRRVEIRLDSDD